MRHPVLARRAAGFALLLLLAADAAAQPAVAPPPRLRGEAAPVLPAGAVTRIGRPRLRLPGAVINVAFAPTGTTFVTAADPPPGSPGNDRLLVLWDAATGREVRQFTGHAGGVEGLAYSADGTRIVTGGVDTTVRVFDVATGAEVKKFAGHANRVLAVAYAPDGKRVASEGQDATIRVWDVERGAQLKLFPGHVSSGTSNLRFSPDGTLLAAVGADLAVRLLSPDTGEVVRRLVGPVKDSESLDFSRDGRRLAAVSEDGVLWVWDVATGNRLLRVQAHTLQAACVRFSPDGTLLATGGIDRTIKFWDAATGDLLRTATGHTWNVSELSFSADGSTLASAGHDGTARLWDVRTAKELPRSAAEYTAFALSPDGKLLATAGPDATARFWDPATGKPARPAVPLGGPNAAIAFASGGTTLYTSISVDDFGALDLGGGQSYRTTIGANPPALPRLATDPAARFVLVAGGGTLRLWAPQAGGPPVIQPRLAAAAAPYLPGFTFALFPGDTHVAVACRDMLFRVFDVSTGEVVMSMPNGAHHSALAASPDGRTLVTVDFNRGLRWWELAIGRERRPRVAVPEVAWAVAFSADGRLVAVGGDRGFVHVLDARTGAALARPAGHTGSVTSLAFTPDGRFLVSASGDLPSAFQAVPGGTVHGDGTAVVWDVAALVKSVPAVPKAATADADRLWAALAGDDAAAADAAVWQLAAAPDVAVPLLRDKLPAVTPGGANVSKLIADLDDDDFDVRERATAQLIGRGPGVVPAVKRALAETKSREVKRRAGEVLAKLGKTGGAMPEERLVARGVEVLQRIHMPEARALIEEWAKGPPDALVAREARIAARRVRPRGGRPSRKRERRRVARRRSRFRLGRSPTSSPGCA